MTLSYFVRHILHRILVMPPMFIVALVFIIIASWDTMIARLLGVDGHLGL